MPKTLYVYREIDWNNEEFLTAHTDMQDCASLGEERIVGIYTLEKVVRLTTKAEAVPVQL